MASDRFVSDPGLIGYGIGQVAVLCNIGKAKDVVRRANNSVIDKM